MKTFTRALLQGGIHTVCWAAVYSLMANVIAADSPAATAYALLSAWWAALYVGYLANVGRAAFPIIFVGYILVAKVCSYLSLPWALYHDGGDFLSFSVGAFAFASPVLLNTTVRFFISRKFVGTQIVAA